MKFPAASGIAIAPILFVIALLAILATAISAATESFSSSSSQEESKVVASTIITQITTMQAAVARVMALGCTDSQITFENSSISGYTNSNAPTDKHCHIFDMLGGGIASLPYAPKMANGTWFTQPSTPNYFYFSINYRSITTCSGFNNKGTPTKEQLLTFVSVNSSVCDAVNAIQGNTQGKPDWNSYLGADKFTGTYPLDGGSTSCGAVPYSGKHQIFCTTWNSQRGYAVFGFLLTR